MKAERSPSAGGFANLGVGVGLRVPHYAQIFNERPSVDFFEIISENFMVDGGAPLRNLDRILESYPVVQHGVSLSLASTDKLDFGYLKKLKALTRRTRTPWFSDHLCWSSTGGIFLHDLLPTPYTPDWIEHIAERARIVQDYIELPFGIENLSSYVSFKQSSMPEWEFYREIVERADCYMLLDVNNIYVSSINHAFDPRDYLGAMPWERVLQMHVAGHTVNDDGTLLDTHDHPVCDEVWEIYRQAYLMSGGVSTLLEWDDHFLSFEDTLRQARRALEFQGVVAAADV